MKITYDHVRNYVNNELLRDAFCLAMIVLPIKGWVDYRSGDNTVAANVAVRLPQEFIEGTLFSENSQWEMRLAENRRYSGNDISTKVAYLP